MKNNEINSEKTIAKELEDLKEQMFKTDDRREKHKLYIQTQELRKVYRQLTGRNYKWTT